MKKFCTNILEKPQNLFLVICLFWSILFAIINPPFQAPDEDSHLYKIYGITQGSWNFKKYTTNIVSGVPMGENLTFSGQILPSGLVQASRFNKRITFKNYLKTSFNETKEIYNIPLNKGNSVFIAYPPPAYGPVSYVPALLVIWILSLFNAPAAVMLFAGRLSSLLVYLAFNYFAIKITPIRKWLFMTLALLPMAVYESSALSVDSLTNGAAFLFIAYVLYLAYDKDVKLIAKKENIIFTVLISLITICKFTYLPLLFLYLIIPKERFQNPKSKTRILSAVLILNVLIAAATVATHIYFSSGVVSFSSSLDKGDLIKFIFLHPIQYLELIVRTLLTDLKYFVHGAIGIFGWVDTYLPDYIIYVCLFLLTFVSSVSYKEESIEISKKTKLLFFSISLICFLLVMTSFYLIFLPDDLKHTIAGCQGRYFLAFTPILGLLLYNNKIKFKTDLFKYIVLFIINFALFVSFIRILARFYI